LSPLLAQLLSSDGVDGAAIRATFELGKNLSHDCSDLRRTARDRRFYCGAKLRVADLSRKVFLERRRFGGLLVGEILTPALRVHLDRFAPALDRFAQDVDDIRVNRIVSQLDLFILDLGEDGTEQQCAGLVLGFAGRIEIALQPGEEVRHSLDVTGATIFTHCRVQLALPALARLFVMAMLAEIGEDARFFAFLLEALERALKVLVVMDYDFRQILLPPFVAFVRRLWDRPINLGGTTGWVKQNPRILFALLASFQP
jgi:hypothetical protein